jgi:inosose dehydratase
VAESLKIARLLADVAEKGEYEQLPFLALADDNGTDAVRTKNAGRTSHEMSLNDEQWKVFARGAEDIARAVKSETGLRTVFHHHCAGFVERPDEVGRLLEITEPDLLGLVFDTGHYTYGSGTNDPKVVQEGLDLFVIPKSQIEHVRKAGIISRRFDMVYFVSLVKAVLIFRRY